MIPVDGGADARRCCDDRPRAGSLLSGAALLVAVVLAAATPPSGDYLYVPNGAHPVAEKVDGRRRRPTGRDGGGIYYVDVTVQTRHVARAARPVHRAPTARRSSRRTPSPHPARRSTERHRGGPGRDGPVGARSPRPSRCGPQASASRRRRAGVLVEAVAIDVPAARHARVRRRDRRGGGAARC